MNILFFLTPKKEVAYIEENDTLCQALEKMEYHKYTAIPILNRRGQYVRTITEGDLLRVVKKQYTMNLQDAENFSVQKIPCRWRYEPVNINCNIEDLVMVSMQQNFVPVVDDEGIFIGIIRRKDIIEYCYKKSCQQQERVTADT